MEDQAKQNNYRVSDFSNKDSLLIVKGHDFNKSNDIDEVINSFAFNGIQSVNLNKAIQILKRVK